MASSDRPDDADRRRRPAGLIALILGLVGLMVVVGLSSGGRPGAAALTGTAIPRTTGQAPPAGGEVADAAEELPDSSADGTGGADSGTTIETGEGAGTAIGSPLSGTGADTDGTSTAAATRPGGTAVTIIPTRRPAPAATVPPLLARPGRGPRLAVIDNGRTTPTTSIAPVGTTTAPRTDPSTGPTTTAGGGTTPVAPTTSRPGSSTTTPGPTTTPRPTTAPRPTTTTRPSTTTPGPTTTARPGPTSAPPTTARPTTSTTRPATTTTVAPTTTAPSMFGKPLFWADEFNGTSVDTSRWRPYFNTYGDGNRELACLTPNNVAVSGGTLRITARAERTTCPGGVVRNYSSGFLGSRETGSYYPRYGYFEMRARLPHAQGLWPAFWLRHRNGAARAEVDPMEYFHVQTPGRTNVAVHWMGVRNLVNQSFPFEAPTTSPGWHTWGVNISPDPSGGTLIEFMFNRNIVASKVITDPAPMNDFGAGTGLWDIAVNLAVGGVWVGDPAGQLGCLELVPRCFDATKVLRASFPVTYEVDYVRVYGTL